MNSTNHQFSESIAVVSQLLEQAEIVGPFELLPLSGGANSKAYRVDIGKSLSLFLKQYFHHPDDPRDRLGTEFAFTSFAWIQGLKTIAKPLAMNREAHCAIYSFLDGRKIEAHEITQDAVVQSLQFFEAINSHKTFAVASRLPAASEACFTLADHLNCLQRRVKRFSNIMFTDFIDRQAQEFVHDELSAACAKHIQTAQVLAARLGIALDAPIADEDRCVSPSDFGFHNVLRRDDGVLQFLDFEYAGWDDPAKLVCDFFCQPACPVPARYYVDFANRIADATSNSKLSRKRFDVLLPIYRLKWCCIMLNDFLPAGGSRRRFANYGLDEVTRKSQQLQKARAALDRCLNETLIELAA